MSPLLIRRPAGSWAVAAVVLSSAALALSSAVGPPSAAAAGPTGAADFDRDGFADLVIGARGEDLAVADDGVVHVIYGDNGRLSVTGTQVWLTLAVGLAAPQVGEHFGTTVAHGDFDGDGFDDLAVAAPDAAVGGAGRAGTVTILRGSAGGLRTAGAQRITADDPSAGDEFGFALATGDFDGDDVDDLAVGVPGKDDKVDDLADVGEVDVYSGTSAGLDLIDDLPLTQDSAGILGEEAAGDRFGSALAAGDFDADNPDDLAIGVPREDVGAQADAGAVNVIYGRALVGLSATNAGGLIDNQLWTQASTDSFGGVSGTPRSGDGFGTALASGNFNGVDGDDLAAGIPHDDVVGGSVNVVYGQRRSGTADGLNTRGNQNWSQSDTGAGGSEAGDDFGFALAAGEFDGNDVDDLSVGVPGEDVGSAADAGAVNAIYGKPSTGLSRDGAEVFVQKALGDGLVSEQFDQFGIALSTGDYDRNGEDDVAIGVPLDRVGGIRAGATNVIYGKNPLIGADGLDVEDHDTWHQNISGVPGGAENLDLFGDTVG